MDTNDKNLVDLRETWIRPEIVVLSVAESTLGNFNIGEDMLSENLVES